MYLHGLLSVTRALRKGVDTATSPPANSVVSTNGNIPISYDLQNLVHLDPLFAWRDIAGRHVSCISLTS